MMAHLFLLIIISSSTGEIVENDRYFYSVSRCIWYANEINMSIYPSQRGISAYCIPKLEDPKNVKVH